ncbi:MAG: alpha/beta hydrolase [Lentisphaerae bacterium]|nr:alpha/beta hydrolase [Lentisphaerota bacterium]
MRLRLVVVVLLLVAVVAPRLCVGGEVTVEAGVVFAQGAVNAHTVPGTNDLLLDVYRPSDPADVTGEALVLVHGGGFVFGDRTSAELVDAAMDFAARGWVCFSIDYRLLGDDPPAPVWIEGVSNPLLNTAHAAFTDTKRAVRWVRAHADDYGCDSNRVAALGHSAGAYCVIQACISDETDFANDQGTAVPDQWPGHSGRPNAGVEVSGGIELNEFEFSHDDSPLMIWHGDNDNTVTNSEAWDIAAECDEHRIPCRFFMLPGADHGEETWTALYDGRGLKDHAFEFLSLFFEPRMGIDAGSTTVTLSWPSVSNAVYDVRSTTNLQSSFMPMAIPAVTSRADTCTVELPAVDLMRLYRTGVLSGQ